MQLFLGGACAGKRAAVRQRFGAPQWHSAYSGKALEQWREAARAGDCLILEGWERWLAAELTNESSDDRLRARFVDELETLRDWETAQDMPVVLVMLEIGRGIVPLAPSERRLRDLNGWLVQDAATHCEHVWYVWNGLVKRLSP